MQSLFTAFRQTSCGKSSMFDLHRPRPLSTHVSLATALILLLCSCVFVTIGPSLLSTPSARKALLRLPADTRTTTTTKTETETGQLPTFRKEWCVFYDKAPRTASSTIGKALLGCWRKLGFAITFRTGKFDTAVPIMLSQHSSFVAMTAFHYSLSRRNVQQLRDNCKHLFYITSTRPMSQRLLSEAKYFVSSAHVRINTTLSDTQLRNVSRELRQRQERSETFFEQYPFLEDEVNNKKDDDDVLLMNPHYVIEADKLDQQFLPLLHAFGCEQKYKSTNVHVVEDQPALQQQLNVNLTMGDRRHKLMLRLAKRVNPAALDIARQAAKAVHRSSSVN